MLRCMGPLQIGHFCSDAANSSLTHALHSAFLHFQIFVGFKFSFVSALVVNNNDPLLMSKIIRFSLFIYVVNNLHHKI